MDNYPTWRIRRRVIIATLAVCAYIVLYLLIKGTDTRLNETLASGAFLLAGSVIGAYVFGATWDDKNILSSKVNRK